MEEIKENKELKDNIQSARGPKKIIDGGLTIAIAGAYFLFGNKLLIIGAILIYVFGFGPCLEQTKAVSDIISSPSGTITLNKISGCVMRDKTVLPTQLRNCLVASPTSLQEGDEIKITNNTN